MRRIYISIAVLLSLLGPALLVPGAASAGGGCHGGRPVTDERSTTVTLSGNCFVATITRVDEGATVTFLNEDDVAHLVTGANFSWGMGSDEADPNPNRQLLKGETFTQRFEASGVYPYFCILHPSMVGAIVVGDGRGAGAATQTSSGSDLLASTGPQVDADEAPAATVMSDDGEASRALTFGFIGGGIALLFGIVVLAKTFASRRAAGG